MRNLLKSESSNYDTIIIGAGIGALTTAAILSRRGEKVLVLEKERQVGGFATLFKRKGFTFDVSLHQIGGLEHTASRVILEQAGVYDRITWSKHHNLTTVKMRNDELFHIPNGDAEQYQKQLFEKFPKEKRAIKRWFRVMKALGTEVLLYESRHRSPVRQALIELFAPVVMPHLIWGALLQIPLSKVMQAKDPELVQLLNHFSLYYGLDTTRIGMVFPMIADYGYHFDGGYYPQGGGHAIAKELVAEILNNGGDVQTGITVNEILHNDEMITGVKTAEDTFAGKKVVAGCSPLSVYGSMLPSWDKSSDELNRMKKMELSLSATVLYLGIACTVEELNPLLSDLYEYSELSSLPEEEFYKLFNERSGFDGGYDEYQIGISFHSHVDPETVPEVGGACFDLFVPDNYDRWKALSPEEYTVVKEQEKEKLLDRLERILPGLRDHIVVCEMGTPLTMERYTGNPKGALYGFAQVPNQAMFSRFKRHSKLKGLFFSSAWTMPGGGYEGSIRSADWMVNLPSRRGRLLFLLFLAIEIAVITGIVKLFV